jgi:thymidylate kinase
VIITIEGPQGSGKTRLARKIKNLVQMELDLNGDARKVKLWDEGEKGMPYRPKRLAAVKDVMIVVKQEMRTRAVAL